MHTIPTSRLAYNLASRSESSFPERHAWSEPDDISHLANSSSMGMNNDVIYAHQPGFPKIDIFAPGLSSFWQQNWLDQSQTLLHHRHPHSSDRIITSPQAHTTPNHHHHHHEFFIPSPISPIQPSDPSAQTEWDILRSSTGPDSGSGHPFPWVPSQTPSQSQHHNPPAAGEPKIKIEDDSDSNWSLNDSLEDAHLPPLLIQPNLNLQRLRRESGSGGRVSKAGRLPLSATTARPVYHTFRVGKRTPTTTTSSSTATTTTATIDLSGSGPYEAGIAEPTGDLSPDDYAAKVQERRIAHKLSEKSRRNRLTAAIREIQKLMPAEKETGPVAEGEVERGEGSSTVEGKQDTGEIVVHPAFSKVDVVEMAVGFIRKLKMDNERLAARVRKAEEKRRASHGRDQGEGRERDEVVGEDPDAVEGT